MRTLYKEDLVRRDKEVSALKLLVDFLLAVQVQTIMLAFLGGVILGLALLSSLG